MEEVPVLYRRPLPPSENYLKRQRKSKKTCSKPLTQVSSFLSDTQSFDGPHIHHLHPKGPPPLPMGKIIRHTDVGTVPSTEQHLFTLSDFLLSTEHPQNKLLVQSQCMMSRENYLKMTGWFATCSPQQMTLHMQTLESE